ERLGVGPRRILGHVHHRHTLLHREGERVLGRFLQVVNRPDFRVLADRTRADEGAAFDRYAGALLDVGNRLDVGDHRAGGAIGLNLHAPVADRAGEALDVARDMWTAAP